MAGIDNLKAAIVAAGAAAAEGIVNPVETVLGHALPFSHIGAHAGEASAVVTVLLGAVGGPLDAPLAAFLAALDARYAAGVHAGPIMANTHIKECLGHACRVGALQGVQLFEEHRGCYEHVTGPGGLQVVARDAVETASKAAASAPLDLFLADLDARYVAGVCASPAGATLAGLVAALEALTSIVAAEGVRELEWANGHTGHAAIHASAAGGAAVAALAADLGTWPTQFLGALDARYAWAA